MHKILDCATAEISAERPKIIAECLEYSQTDLLLFFSEKPELYQRQKQEWQPIIDWVGEFLKTPIRTTSSLDVPDNRPLQIPLKQLLNGLTDKELSCFYAAALNMRSIILALSLIKKRLTAEQANHLAYLEELWQNENWGEIAEADQKRKERCDELQEIAAYLAV